jgi:hypothetical protein
MRETMKNIFSKYRARAERRIPIIYGFASARSIEFLSFDVSRLREASNSYRLMFRVCAKRRIPIV